LGGPRGLLKKRSSRERERGGEKKREGMGTGKGGGRRGLSAGAIAVRGQGFEADE